MKKKQKMKLKKKGDNQLKTLKLHIKKATLPPGTALPPEEEPLAPFIVFSHWFTEHGVVEAQFPQSEAFLSYKAPEASFSWIHLSGIAQALEVKNLLVAYKVHELVIEDIVSTVQRPKIEDFGSYLFIIARRACSSDVNFTLLSEQAGFLLFDRTIITFEEGPSDLLTLMRSRIRELSSLFTRTPEYISYIFIDTLVDSFFQVLESLNNQLDNLEEEIFLNPIPSHLEQIYAAKTELTGLRKIAWPLREVASSLERNPTPLIGAETRIYLRDVYDHTFEVVDILETLRDMTTGLLDIYLSSANNRLSEVMKVLTVITTIFMPLTLIAGIYGMNFQHMPELSSEWGYPLVLGSMVTIALSMVFYFKKKRWL